MGFVFNVLTSPALGPIRGVHWLAGKVLEQAEHEYFDEDRVRAQMLELQARYDLGEVSEEDYDKQETILLERLNAIREAKTQSRQR